MDKSESNGRVHALEAARGIIFDLSDRRGIGHEWVQIDPEIQEEILEKWTVIIMKHME